MIFSCFFLSILFLFYFRAQTQKMPRAKHLCKECIRLPTASANPHQHTRPALINFVLESYNIFFLSVKKAFFFGENFSWPGRFPKRSCFLFLLLPSFVVAIVVQPSLSLFNLFSFLPLGRLLSLFGLLQRSSREMFLELWFVSTDYLPDCNRELPDCVPRACQSTTCTYSCWRCSAKTSDTQICSDYWPTFFLVFFFLSDYFLMRSYSIAETY